MKILLTTCILTLSLNLWAQEQTTPRQFNFTTKAEKGGVRFIPDCPPLPEPIPGAPEPYYTYYWEFGDGDFSDKESPIHHYSAAGPHTALLDATAHYDDHNKPPGYARSIMADASESGGAAFANVFPKNEDRLTIAMKTIRKPRPEEELICIISYRNNSSYVTDGRLHLFFNEKKFPSKHFNFNAARTHYGEVQDAQYSQLDRPEILDWTTLLGEGMASAGDAAPAYIFAPPTPRTEMMLKRARDTYHEEQSWRFTQLIPGETRNLFVTLGSTASMLKDTSAFIHLHGLLEPFDPAIPAGEFTVEIEIVSSHDPNAIAVSENRVNYRRLGTEKLDYKVQFQNNGEGPAKKVELTITVPEGLNTARMRPLSWYPECPICPKEAIGQKTACLDTASFENGLRFTFQNIYLPGSRQEGVEEYDSTKGFVRYRLEPYKNMPKRAFRSQAKIVFDKNKPIYTNFSKTRFKIGISPGPKIGYAFRPDSSGSGYLFMGMSLSPYKSWKIYPQVELLTGIKGRTELPETVTVDSTRGLPEMFTGEFARYYDTLSTTRTSGSSGFFTLEIPLLLRKNFTKFFGAGIGVNTQLIFEDYSLDKISDRVERKYEWMDSPGGMGFILVNTDERELDGELTHESSTNTSFRFSVFADMTLGAVRAGPNIGIRAGGMLHDGFQPFIQISLEYKL